MLLRRFPDAVCCLLLALLGFPDALLLSKIFSPDLRVGHDLRDLSCSSTPTGVVAEARLTSARNHHCRRRWETRSSQPRLSHWALFSLSFLFDVLWWTEERWVSPAARRCTALFSRSVAVLFDHILVICSKREYFFSHFELCCEGADLLYIRLSLRICN
jgi:hypothetical protein